MKLQVLPQPDIFLRLIPSPAQAHLLELMLNRIFTGDAIRHLEAIHGKTMLFHTPENELQLYVRIDHDGFHVAGSGQSPDVTIRGDLASLAALCLGLEDTDSLFFSRRLLLTGDTAVGLLFKNLLTNLDFDLRHELEQQLGRRATTLLWNMATHTLQAVETVDDQLLKAGTMLGGRLGLSPASEVKTLQAEVRRLRNAQAELEQRLKRPGRRPRPHPVSS